MQEVQTIVSVKQNAYSLRLVCPYCSKIHKHGGGSSSGVVNFGQRLSHCKINRRTYILIPHERQNGVDFNLLTE